MIAGPNTGEPRICRVVRGGIDQRRARSRVRHVDEIIVSRTSSWTLRVTLASRCDRAGGVVMSAGWSFPVNKVTVKVASLWSFSI